MQTRTQRTIRLLSTAAVLVFVVGMLACIALGCMPGCAATSQRVEVPPLPDAPARTAAASQPASIGDTETSVRQQVEQYVAGAVARVSADLRSEISASIRAEVTGIKTSISNQSEFGLGVVLVMSMMILVLAGVLWSVLNQTRQDRAWSHEREIERERTRQMVAQAPNTGGAE